MGDNTTASGFASNGLPNNWWNSLNTMGWKLSALIFGIGGATRDIHWLMKPLIHLNLKNKLVTVAYDSNGNYLGTDFLSLI